MDRRRVLLGCGSVAVSALVLPRIARAEEDDSVRLRDLYNKDLSFSDYALSMDGKRASVLGYMAPPLKADTTFFVLTNRPLAVCPFCESSVDWPDDILAIYTKRIYDVLSYNSRIRTRGILTLGEYKDPETGFVSRVRLLDSYFEKV